MFKKNIFIISIILVLSIVLAACGSSDNTDGNKSNDSKDNKSNNTIEKQSNKLTVYASFQDEESDAYIKSFEEATGVEVKYVRLSGGEALARLEAESKNPQASLWFGSSGDTFEAAASKGLFEPYEAKGIEELPEDLAVEGNRWTPTYTGVIGFATNTDWLEKNGVEAPETWDDLLKPEFDNNLSIAHPATSGASFFVLATLVQLKGEDEAFDYLKDLDSNIRQYTQSGTAPANNVGLGEAVVGIQMAHDILEPIKEGYPIQLTIPEDTGVEVGGLALIKGGPADEIENAKKFADWAISKEGQSVFAENGFSRLPLHPDAKVPEGITPLSELKTFRTDSVKAGESRNELVNRFEDQIKGADAAK